MYKAELVSAIVEKAGTKKKDTEAVLNAFVEVVKAAVEAGDKVEFDQVLMIGGEAAKVGNPVVDGAKVVGEVTAQRISPVL